MTPLEHIQRAGKLIEAADDCIRTQMYDRAAALAAVASAHLAAAQAVRGQS